MRRVNVLSLVPILLSFAILVSAETSVPEKLSLADAVALSLNESIGLKAAAVDRQASLSRLKIAELKTSYSLGSRVDLRNSSDDSTFSNIVYTDLSYENAAGTEATVELSPMGIGTERGAVGLLVRHPLTRGRGELSDKGSLIRDSKASVVISDYELFQSRQETVLGVMEAYYDAVLAREQVKVEEGALDLAKEVADGTRKREAEGLVTGIQTSRAEINVARTENSLNLQRSTARGALDRLMLAMGVGIGQSPDLVDSVPEVLPEMPSLEEAIKKAWANRTELMVYDQRISIQERDLAMRKDAARPALNAVASFSSTNEDTGLLSTSVFDSGTAVLGLELSLPLDMRAIKENRQIAERSLDVLKQQREFRMDQMAEEVRRAYRSYEAAKMSLDIYSQNLATAEKGLRDAQILVEEGEAENREILDAQQALTEVQNGVLEAKTDLYLACIRVKLAMGEDLTTMGRK